MTPVSDLEYLSCPDRWYLGWALPVYRPRSDDSPEVGVIVAALMDASTYPVWLVNLLDPRLGREDSELTADVFSSAVAVLADDWLPDERGLIAMEFWEPPPPCPRCHGLRHVGPETFPVPCPDCVGV